MGEITTVLPKETALRVGEDVFSRSEADGRIFVQRPGGRDGQIVRLIRRPASTWWSRIEGGIRLDRLIEESTTDGCGREDVEAFVASLIRDGFIPVANPQVVQASHAYPAKVSLFEDPWAYQFSQPSLWSPWFVLWEIADKCSQHCTFCYNPERTNAHVGLGQAGKVVAELVRNRVPHVTLLGGEPLLNVHIEEIIRLLTSHRIYTKVITNGILVTPGKARRLKQAGLKQVALSLDALTPALNDLTRGPSSFHHFAKAREALGREIPCISLSLTVSSATLQHLDRLPEFCREWDLDDVYLSQLRDINGVEYPPGIYPLTREQIAEMNMKAEQINRTGTKVICLQQCSCGRSSAVLQPDGSIRPCPFAAAPIDDMNRGDFAQDWSLIARKAATMGPHLSSSRCFRSFEQEPIRGV